MNMATNPVQGAAQSVTKRLQQDLFDLMSYQSQQLMKKGATDEKPVTAFPDGDNLLRWVATIEGPKHTVYEGLTYKLSFDFPRNYPYAPPTVKFVTSCYHPNVDKDGNICLDILKEKWSSLMTVRTVLVSLQSLLGEPNIDSPLNGHAAELWKNQKAYKEMLLKSDGQCENIKKK